MAESCSSHMSNDKIFTEARTRFYGAEIILAIQYLHDQGIIYRDLKVLDIKVGQV